MSDTKVNLKRIKFQTFSKANAKENSFDGKTSKA